MEIWLRTQIQLDAIHQPTKADGGATKNNINETERKKAKCFKAIMRRGRHWRFAREGMLQCLHKSSFLWATWKLKSFLFPQPKWCWNTEIMHTHTASTAKNKWNVSWSWFVSCRLPRHLKANATKEVSASYAAPPSSPWRDGFWFH